MGSPLRRPRRPSLPPFPPFPLPILVDRPPGPPSIGVPPPLCCWLCIFAATGSSFFLTFPRLHHSSTLSQDGPPSRERGASMACPSASLDSTHMMLENGIRKDLPMRPKWVKPKPYQTKPHHTTYIGHRQCDRLQWWGSLAFRHLFE